jgi:DNA-binding NarL/FixJ family response regulator
MTNQSPIKVFITGAANGLAEVREGLADHPDVELVGTAADPVKAGAKLAESAAQVILHGTTATEHVPTTEVEAIRAVTAAPIVLVTSASANSLLSEALQAGVHDVVLLPQLTDGIVFTIKKAHSLAAGRTGLQPGGPVRPQASAADAPARPRPPVRRRRHHDGDRAGQDHL